MLGELVVVAAWLVGYGLTYLLRVFGLCFVCWLCAFACVLYCLLTGLFGFILLCLLLFDFGALLCLGLLFPLLVGLMF